MNKKMDYESPVSELVEIKFGENILSNVSDARLYNNGEDQDW